MRGVETYFAASFQRRMGRDERAVLEDADAIGEHVNVQNAAARRIRDAVKVAANANHAFMRHAAFEPKDGLIGRGRQSLERALFLGEGFVGHTPGRDRPPQSGPISMLVH